MRAAEKTLDHLEAHVVKRELVREVGAVDQEMQMVAVGQARLARLVPRFGVEMQAEHHVRLELRVDALSALADLAVAVKQALVLPLHGLLLLRIVRAFEVVARLWVPGAQQNLASRLPSGRAGRLIRRRRVLLPNHRNSGAELAQLRRDELRDEQRHVAFLHRLAVADLKPAFLHPRPSAANVARIKRDFQSGQLATAGAAAGSGRRGASYAGIGLRAPSSFANRSVNHVCSSRSITMRAVSVSTWMRLTSTPRAQ